MRAVMFALLCLFTFAATASAQSGDQTATGMESGFWLTSYEHPEREWNTMAGSWVHGFYKGATMFGGVQCPQGLSVRTLAAATADVIKQRKQPKEDAAFAVLVAATRQGCSVDAEAIRRAADLPEKRWGAK
jgi:hypothetical protein